jgi:hypothetical protein
MYRYCETDLFHHHSNLFYRLILRRGECYRFFRLIERKQRGEDEMKACGTPGERMRAAVLVLFAMVGTWGCQGGGGGDPDGGDTDDVDTDSDTDTGQDCYEGDLAIATADDVALLEPYDCVAGSVTVLDTGLTVLDLSWIKGVDGDLIVGGNDDLASLDLGALVAVWGGFNLGYMTEDEEVRGNPALTSVDLSSLAAVGGEQTIYANTALPRVELPKLLSVGGDLRVGGVSGEENPALETLSMPALLFVEGRCVIVDNASLASLELGALTSVGGYLAIGGTDFLETIWLGSLASVGGNLGIHWTDSLETVWLGALTSVGGSVSASRNSSLATIAMPSLVSVGEEIEIHSNPKLESLAMGSLVSAGYHLTITENALLTDLGLGALKTLGCTSETGSTTHCLQIWDNFSLPQCDACELLDQLEGFTEPFYIKDNKPDECPNDCE